MVWQSAAGLEMEPPRSTPSAVKPIKTFRNLAVYDSGACQHFKLTIDEWCMAVTRSISYALHYAASATDR